MKNNYEKIRLVSSVADVRDLVQSKSLILVEGWKKPVSASFIGCMREYYIDELIAQSKMHVVQILTNEAVIKILGTMGNAEYKPVSNNDIIFIDESGDLTQEQMDAAIKRSRKVTKSTWTGGAVHSSKDLHDKIYSEKDTPACDIKNPVNGCVTISKSGGYVAYYNGEWKDTESYTKVVDGKPIPTIKDIEYKTPPPPIPPKGRIRNPETGKVTPAPLTMSEAVGRTSKAFNNLGKAMNDKLIKDVVDEIVNKPTPESNKPKHLVGEKPTPQPSLLQRFLNWCKS